MERGYEFKDPRKENSCMGCLLVLNVWPRPLMFIYGPLAGAPCLASPTQGVVYESPVFTRPHMPIYGVVAGTPFLAPPT